MNYTPEHDLNHNAPKDPAHLYACHNKPDSRVTRAWLNRKMVRGIQAIDVVKTEWRDVGCGHTAKQSDPCCENCKWR